MRRIAIIGAGARAEAYVRALQEIPDAGVTWIADPQRDRAELLARTAGATPSIVDEEAIAAQNVDLVVVAAPTEFHREIVELAARHGKHVLCEAPIATTPADARAMIAACDSSGVRLMVGHSSRFAPEYARVKAALDDGVLGQIGVVRTSRVGPGDDNGAASAVEIMIDDLDVLRWWFGDVTRVFALNARTAPNGSHGNYLQAVMRFENGVIAHVEASRAHAVFRTTVEIAGEHGVLTFDSDESATFRLDTPAHHGDARSVDRFGPWMERARHAQIQHFMDRLDDGAPFTVSGEDGLRAVELSLAVARSAESGQPVRFEAGLPITVEASS